MQGWKSIATDRPLDPAFIRKRKRTRIIRFSVAGASLIILYLSFSAWISPSVQRDQLRIATVDSGSVEATISASGTVLPEFEEVISSPADSRVLRVLRQPGEKLKKGDQFLLVDLSGPQLALERVDKDLLLALNRSQQLTLDEGHRIEGLESQLHIKELNLAYLKAKTVQEQKLYELGGSSRDHFEQVRLEEEIAQTEQADLKQTIANARQSLENRQEGLRTEIATLRKEKADIQRQIDVLACRAPADGVLTMVSQEIGAILHRGDVIARIANLNAYRVEGTTSDIHAGALAVGQRTHVLWADGGADGAITAINPSLDHGTIRFSVGLRNKADARLRANLRVDIAVVTAAGRPSLRLAKGPFLTPGTRQNLFVVRGDRAVRTPVTLGVEGVDEVSIIDGLALRDVVILSDMKEYEHAHEVILR